MTTGTDPTPTAGPILEITASRSAQVGRFDVRRALPRRGRRTVGAWCFVDHFGPVDDPEGLGLEVAPHPHIGLQTVTWLLAGEGVHRDSLGTEQVIRPGQLNLMSAGRGVAHAEEGTGRPGGALHGVQLWVAQPAATRDGPAAFEHHRDPPQVELGGGSEATVLVGAFAGTASPARRDTDHVGVDLELRAPTTTVPLDATAEYALVVTRGSVLVEGHTVVPGSLAYLGSGRSELPVRTLEPAHTLLIGGAPFEAPILMWWNFVARAREEIAGAYDDWSRGTDRFGPVASPLARVEVDPPAWTGHVDNGGP